MSVGLIWAEARGGVIGQAGGMPWHLPEDLAHFKQITLGNPVVMGRRTWDSITPRFRPLPGRRNIVITRQTDWSSEGAEVAHSLDDALELAADAEDTWVIGGGQIFGEAIHTADRLEVTEIDAAYSGDSFAPTIDPGWIAVTVEPRTGWDISSTGIPYRFLRYERAGA
jgi:dihydrofolate reductase